MHQEKSCKRLDKLQKEALFFLAATCMPKSCRSRRIDSIETYQAKNPTSELLRSRKLGREGRVTAKEMRDESASWEDSTVARNVSGACNLWARDGGVMDGFAG